MSYGDPHHAYDPPVAEDYINWKDIAPYDAFGESDAQRLEWLDQKPWHWREWYTGDTFISFEALEGYSYQSSSPPTTYERSIRRYTPATS